MDAFASLYNFAEVNPPTREFMHLNEGESISFMPLENIWSYGNADTNSKRAWKRSDTSYTQFRKGDILVPKVTPTVFHGRSMIANISEPVGLATSEVHVLRCKEQVDSRWIVYNLLSGKFLDEARGAVYGVGGLQRISPQYLGAYKIRNIPLATQRRIADYLDAETAQIDALVTEMDEYVELLEKRRNQIVELAVKQGIDDDSYRKFSMVSNGFFVKYLGGKDVPKGTHSEDGYPVYGSGGRFDTSDQFLYNGRGVLLGRKGTIDKPRFVEGKFWLIDTAYFACPNAQVLDPKESVRKFVCEALI